MDDTVWHCEFKNDLQNILDDISELYQLNNIQVNPSKSDLIHIIPNKKTSSNTIQDTTPLNFNNQPITPRKPNETIRYLGIFLDGKGSTKPTLEKIFSKVSQFIHIIQYKKLLLYKYLDCFILFFQHQLNTYFKSVLLYKTNFNDFQAS